MTAEVSATQPQPDSIDPGDVVVIAPTMQTQPGASDSAQTTALPGQGLGQLLIAVVFFVLGFGVAMVITQLNVENTRAIYQEALDDAVAAVVAALPPASGVGEAVSEQPVAPDPNRRYAVSADDDPYHGPEDAPVLIVEFSDFRCTYCGRFATTTLEPLLARYGDQVQFVYRDFPVLGDTSFQAAMAAECADDQGAFWEYHDLLFANQQTLGSETFLAFAQDLGLDLATFQRCLDNETYREEVIADFNDARNLGASGTPTFFINGRFLVGAQPLQVFEGIIDDELAANPEG